MTTCVNLNGYHLTFSYDRIFKLIGLNLNHSYDRSSNEVMTAILTGLNQKQIKLPRTY